MADSVASPLSGKTVFVSRSPEKNDEISRAVESKGANCISVPLIRFGPPDDFGPLDSALNNLASFDWLIFTSQVAVAFTLQRAATIGVSIAESDVAIATVGPATANAAKEAGLRVERISEQGSGTGLVRELALKGKRILLPRSQLALASVIESLEKSGNEVTAVVAYRTLPLPPSDRRKQDTIRWGIIDAALFFSPSSVHHFVDWLGMRTLKEHHQHVVFVAVGPTTAEALRKSIGFGQIIQSSEPTLPAVLRCLEDFLRDQHNKSSVSVSRQ